MLKKYSLKALQKAMNKAMALDESMPKKIQQLDGKVLEIIISPLALSFYIQFSGDEIHLLPHYPDAADTVIHSNPIGLIRLSLLPASKARSLFNDKIRISGDIELGQQVKQLFDSMDIDWEAHLAHFTGDVIAHKMGSLFRRSRQFASQFQDSMQQNVTEYIQEEIRLCPSRAELDDFFNDIDTLALGVERLEAKVKQIKARHEIN